MSTRRLPALALVPAAMVLAGSLSGCSQIANTLHKTHEESFDDRAAAIAGWVGTEVPEWIPADATEIHNLATTDESSSVIRVRSTRPLPEACVDAERLHVPFDAPGWAPQLDRFPDRVERCGDYEVMPVDGGYLGWFTATESGQTPGPQAG